jgi:Txe/YoeB family toxin of Txe-Axe toxin-antitoxin module
VWSRRVRGRHRLVYALDDRDLVVLQARYQEG